MDLQNSKAILKEVPLVESIQYVAAADFSNVPEVGRSLITPPCP